MVLARSERSAQAEHAERTTLALGAVALETSKLAQSIHRRGLDSAISFQYAWNMAIRLFVNSAMTLRNSTGDLIVASLWVKSKANCKLA